MADAQRPLIAAVPELATYHAQTGIGRVFQSLCNEWGERVRPVNATFTKYPLPIVRNFPLGIQFPPTTDLVLLPKLTGAQALRGTKGKPSLVIVHDIGIVDFPGDREGTDWFSYESVRRSFISLQYATLIGTDSHFTCERLIHYLPEVAPRTHTIHAGVSDLFFDYASTPEQARQRIDTRLNQSTHSPLLSYVGTELPRKNIPFLLHAFRRIKERYTGAQLLKVGAPGHPRWREATLQCAADLGLKLGEDILILEHIDDATLADSYRASDVFVSTSLYEGFGLPALEAMAVGTPVVVTQCGSFPEIVQDRGWCVPPQVDAVVQAIDEALSLSDGQREERSQKGRAHAATFRWSHAATRYLELMHQLVEGEAPR